VESRGSRQDELKSKSTILSPSHLGSLSRKSTMSRLFRKLMGTNMKSKESRRVCTHESEYVELNFYRSAVDDAAEMFLMGRDLHASNNVMEIGCDEIVFPWYRVLEAELQPDQGVWVQHRRKNHSKSLVCAGGGHGVPTGSR